jgi:hypothetical protein
VQIYNGGAMGAAPDLFYLAYPVELDGTEIESGTATPTADTTQTIVVDVLGHAPSVGDILTAAAVGGRWVAECGGSAGAGDGCFWPCSTTVAFAAPGSGSTANGYVVIGSGSVISITLAGTGSGYTAVHPSVTITAPPAGGTIATATATVGGVTSTAITNGGSGYTSATVTFSAAPGGGTTATGTAILSGGVVTGITLTDAGAGYTANPTVTIGGPGTLATATAIAGVGKVTSVVMTDNGSGYVDPLPIPAAFSVTITGNGYTYGPYTVPLSPAYCQGITNFSLCYWSTTISGITWQAPPVGSSCVTGPQNLAICVGNGEILLAFSRSGGVSVDLAACTTRPYGFSTTTTLNPEFGYLVPGIIAWFQALGGLCTNNSPYPISVPPSTFSPSAIDMTVTVSEV